MVVVAIAIVMGVVMRPSNHGDKCKTSRALCCKGLTHVDASAGESKTVWVLFLWGLPDWDCVGMRMTTMTCRHKTNETKESAEDLTTYWLCLHLIGFDQHQKCPYIHTP